MTYQEKINVMASWVCEPGEPGEPDQMTYDEPTGHCDGSSWVRHSWACTPAMWAEARELAKTFYN